jgi:hypothetical protein
MFGRFAAVSLVAVALLGCDRATPSAPTDGLQPSAVSSTHSTGSLAGDVKKGNGVFRGDVEGGEGEDQGGNGRVFNVTFTKWVTDWPNMAGIVGGDAGDGAFAGEVLNFTPGAEITRIEALYHINGGTHSFTAHNFVTQNEVTRTAVVEGVIVDGWLKGRKVNGAYVIISCPDKTGGLCYRGALEIQPGLGR